MGCMIGSDDEAGSVFHSTNNFKCQGGMSAAAIKYLAQKADDNFRQIEGGVIKVMAVSEIKHCKISKTLINQALDLT